MPYMSMSHVYVACVRLQHVVVDAVREGGGSPERSGRAFEPRESAHRKASTGHGFRHRHGIPKGAPLTGP